MSKAMRVCVLVSGGGTNLQAILDAVSCGSLPGVEIVGVISNNPGVYALTRAENAGVPSFVVSPKTFENRAAFEKAYLERVNSLTPDLVVLAGCLVKIPEEMIRTYPNRIVNIHPALIPAFSGKNYYGLKVHEAALARGVRLSGATVHFVTEDLDAGPIILQKAVEVHEDDTPKTLQRRIMEEAEWKLLPEAIRLIAAGRVTVSEGRVHIAPEA